MAGNSKMAHNCKNFSEILNTLSDHTWGLTVSLQDISHLSMSRHHSAHQLPKRSEAYLKTHANYDYKES